MNDEVLHEDGINWERNNRIWSLYLAGVTPRKLADTFHLSVHSIHHIVAGRRQTLPQETVDEIRTRSLAYLNDLGGEVMAIFQKRAPVVTSGKDGDVVYDPETGEAVRDYGTQLQAALVALRILERIHKVVGVDAPKVQVHLEASEAAIEQANKLRTGKFKLLLGEAESA
jgi:hypothetical protein